MDLKNKSLELLVTLQPSFPHFAEFASDPRISGVRLNTAMVFVDELENEFNLMRRVHSRVPVWFDVKGWQLRIEAVHRNSEYLDITLNHPISVVTPTPVLFKAGADSALLVNIIEDGRRLIFKGGPKFNVIPGESICIRHPTLRLSGPLFTDAEFQKIDMAKAAGFRNFFLSYVESQRDVDQFLELVGRDSTIMLKIENKKGLRFVSSEFNKRENLRLVAAQGDLYVEVNQPHDILSALRLIIEKDPEACVGSRLLLSINQGPVPELVDFMQLAWLYDAGYRSMMLCDEICLKADLLDTAVNAFSCFRSSYIR